AVMRFSSSCAGILAGWLVLSIPPCPLGGAEATGLSNLGFEEGKRGWDVWYSDDPKFQGPRFPWTIDQTVSRVGKTALRIDADDRKGRIFVHQATRQFTRGARYELSYWVRFSSSEMYDHCAVTVNLIRNKPDGKGSDRVQIDPVTFYKRDEASWLH